jgi:hypothetical protein
VLRSRAKTVEVDVEESCSRRSHLDRPRRHRSGGRDRVDTTGHGPESELVQYRRHRQRSNGKHAARRDGDGQQSRLAGRAADDGVRRGGTLPRHRSAARHLPGEVRAAGIQDLHPQRSHAHRGVRHARRRVAADRRHGREHQRVGCVADRRRHLHARRPDDLDGTAHHGPSRPARTPAPSARMRARGSTCTASTAATRT